VIIKLQWKSYEGGGSHVSFDTEDISSLVEAKDGGARLTLKSGYSMSAVQTYAEVHDLWVQGRARAESAKAVPPTGAPSWGYAHEGSPDYDDHTPDSYGE
jgi:hypothetical protein